MSDMPPHIPGPQDPVPLSSAAGTPVVPSPGADGSIAASAADVEKNKILAVLAYIGILVLVPILAGKDSPFARYHANQGLILLILAVVGWIPLLVISFIPIVGCIAMVILAFWGLIILALMIVGIINAANGKMVPLPVVGQFKILK